MNKEELTQKAKELVGIKKLHGDAVSGEVGSALVTDKGTLYVGVSLDAPCGAGFCGEYNAIGAMLTGGESRIDTIVAVGENGDIMSPCGKCRELMYQVNAENADTNVVMTKDNVMKLEELLPRYWQN